MSTPKLTREALIERLSKFTANEVFPPCSDVMLALVTTNSVPLKDDIVEYFDEYFEFGPNTIIDNAELKGLLNAVLLSCNSFESDNDGEHPSLSWPPMWCLPPSCVILSGNRNSPVITPPPPRISRLFIADIVWLFYFERMGVFQILGAILDDFATKGRIPISNGSLNGANGAKDRVLALILEAMVRQTKMGTSSTVRDRDSSYRRCLGWTTETGRKLGMDTAVNTGFSTLFHKFIQSALEYYKDKRLAVAIRDTLDIRPSVATLITISDTIGVLKKTFESFDYGRNYYNALSGIVWVIAAMSLIRELRTSLGIPPVYGDPHEYIPAAYDLLVLKKPATPSQTNRYTIHRECARTARDILLDIQVLTDQTSTFGHPDGELEDWLTLVEARIEGYRTAYRTLTGVDLGTSGTPTIEQQV